MATLPNSSEWVDVYQLEQADPVLGGEPNESTGAGMDNIPHLHLAKRTNWLKAKVDALVDAVVAASTTAAGIVRLNNTLTSTATDQALTAAQGKVLNDQKAPKASPSFTGNPTAPNPAVAENSTAIATTAWVRSALSTLAQAAGFAVSLGITGYIRLPTWLGGLIIQWGDGAISETTAGQTMTLPIAYPTAHLQCLSCDAGYNSFIISSEPNGLTGIKLYALMADGNRPTGAYVRWLSIGY